MKKEICCICKKQYIGYSNNALPIMNGRCCNKCNQEIVIPARLKEIIEYKEK